MSAERPAASRRDRRASAVEVAFAKWCAREHMVEDADAPHGEAFYAGFYAGVGHLGGALIGKRDDDAGA